MCVLRKNVKNAGPPKVDVTRFSSSADASASFCRPPSSNIRLRARYKLAAIRPVEFFSTNLRNQVSQRAR